MSTQLIRKFRNVHAENILLLLATAIRYEGVDCINVSKYSRTTAAMEAYSFLSEDEVVIVLLDWRAKPELETIQDDITLLPPFMEENRVNPISRLSEFMSQYMKAMVAKNVKIKKVWGVLVSNSFFDNYASMAELWEKKHVTVFHDIHAEDSPYVRMSERRSELMNAHSDALYKWFDERDDLKYPYRGEYGETECYEDIEDMEKHFYREGFTTKDVDWESEKEEEFNRLLDEFVHGEFGEKDSDSNDDDDDDDDFEMPELPETYGPKYRKPVSVEILPPTSSPHEELDNMVGCDNIKKQINDLLDLTRYNRWMRSHFPLWKQHQVSLHAIFIGRPGTGKTTVCKIYGALLKEAGMLTKGHVVVCNRATFVGSNWGDEEEAVNQVLELAEGGVLMIDEAYLLNTSHPNDPGKFVLPLFMDKLADENRRNIAVVLCGYKAPMEGLLNLNPGLVSRFPNRFEFKDFSVEELMEITRRRLGVYNYHFTHAGLLKYKEILTQAYTNRNPENWGNARFVANLLERIYLLHAKRCMKSKSSREYKRNFSITPSDIQPIDVPKDKKRIGF